MATHHHFMAERGKEKGRKWKKKEKNYNRDGEGR